MFPGQQPTTSKVYNVNTNHPLIENSQEYVFYKKYVSIHSEDRDSIKFPNSNEFEIELPEDLINVHTVRLVHWTFPANYDTFSSTNSNVTMTFKINNPYNPGENGLVNELYEQIFNCLFMTKDENFNIIIQEGFYNPQQMVTELTNKFNYAVSLRINNYFRDTASPYYNPVTFPILLDEFNLVGGYTNFVIVYNAVSQKIWFGNRADGFILTNSSQLAKNTATESLFCTIKKRLPDFTDWGLPGYLGLTRSDTESTSGSQVDKYLYGEFRGAVTPRFFYGDISPGDDGYWLLPNNYLPDAAVYWVECPFKINLMGQAYFYMEIDKLNCIDETSPFSLSKFTITTNETYGVVNSAFAKIAVPTTPISQWFDREAVPYKEFVPPAERIRRLKIKLRYHNDQLVDFGVFNYSFLLEFAVFQPQQARSYKSAMSGVIGK